MLILTEFIEVQALTLERRVVFTSECLGDQPLRADLKVRTFFMVASTAAVLVIGRVGVVLFNSRRDRSGRRGRESGASYAVIMAPVHFGEDSLYDHVSVHVFGFGLVGEKNPVPEDVTREGFYVLRCYKRSTLHKGAGTGSESKINGCPR